MSSLPVSCGHELLRSMYGKAAPCPPSVHPSCPRLQGGLCNGSTCFPARCGIRRCARAWKTTAAIRSRRGCSVRGPCPSVAAVLQRAAGAPSPLTFPGSLVPPTSPWSRSPAADRLEPPPRDPRSHRRGSTSRGQRHPPDLLRPAHAASSAELFLQPKPGFAVQSRFSLCWVHGWLGAEWGCRPTPCLRGCLGRAGGCASGREGCGAAP